MVGRSRSRRAMSREREREKVSIVDLGETSGTSVCQGWRPGRRCCVCACVRGCVLDPREGSSWTNGVKESGCDCSIELLLSVTRRKPVLGRAAVYRNHAVAILLCLDV